MINKRNKNSASGQSLVEIGLTMVAVLTLLAGVVDLGSAFFDYISLRDAAQEGALYGSFNPVIESTTNGKSGVYDAAYDVINKTNIVARVRYSSSQPINLADSTKVGVNVIFCNSDASCNSSTENGLPCQGGSNAVAVTVSYNYRITMPFLGAILRTQTIPLRARMIETILAPTCP
jgi:Flp pilus assembly protein TadG